MNELEKFHCKLAIELGLPLIAVLNLPAWEIYRWQEYFSENMFTQDRLAYQLALIATLFYNANTEEKAELMDFLIKFQPVRDDPETLIAKLESLRGLLGG